VGVRIYYYYYFVHLYSPSNNKIVSNALDASTTHFLLSKAHHHHHHPRISSRRKSWNKTSGPLLRRVRGLAAGFCGCGLAAIEGLPAAASRGAEFLWVFRSSVTLRKPLVTSSPLRGQQTASSVSLSLGGAASGTGDGGGPEGGGGAVRRRFCFYERLIVCQSVCPYVYMSP